jgi:hypothetical protein
LLVGKEELDDDTEEEEVEWVTEEVASWALMTPWTGTAG